MQTPKLVFIIENDHQTRVNLRFLYERNGHKVVSTASPLDALRILENINKPDLILIGKDFPLYSANSFITKINGEERFRDIKIVTLQRDREAASKRLALNVLVHDTTSLLSIIHDN